MIKRAKSCFEFKEINDVLYRCRYGGEKTWIFLCENCLSFVKKKYQADYQIVALGKVIRNCEKFCNLYFICLGDNDHRISCRLDNFPTNALINGAIFLKG